MMERDSVEKVKASVDIVSVISGYVSLKKRGRTYVGLCPFHKEKTPSFHVDAERQTYKCFGCGKGGDVFSFLMDMKGTSFPEVLKDLAREAGIIIETQAGRNAKSENSGYFEANAFALEFYRKMLQSAKGEAARDYLKGRGISRETMEAFELGYAPDSWDELSRALKAKGIGTDTAFRCGLLAERKNGGYYDRFRGRVMFPIRDISSEVVGFGGRIMGQGEPKYLNSPESAIFKKRRLIYNLWKVKSLIRGGPVVIVEGYMDVVSLSNAGFPNAVATLGTALTEDHVRSLGRFTDKIFLVFDGDAAGRSAMLRSVEPFFAGDVMPRVVLLPDGKDPDDMARTDPGLWKSLMEKAPFLWEFVFDESFSTRDTSKLEDKKAVMKELVPLISGIKDPLVREILAQRLAVRLGVSEEVIVRQVRQDKGEAPVTIRDNSGAGNTPLEDIVVRLMLYDDHAVAALRELDLAGRFQGGRYAALIRYLAERGRQGLDSLDCPEDVRRQASQLLSEGEFPGDAKKALIDTACRFKSLTIDSEIQKIQRDLFRAEEDGNRERRNELLRKRQLKMEERKHIREYVAEVLQRI